MAARAEAVATRPPLLLALVGPKGAGKSHLGRLLAARCRLPFFDVEAFMLGQPDPRMARGDGAYRALEKALAAYLADAGEASFEVTGASPYTTALFEHLGAAFRLRRIRVDAPLEVCLERVAARPAEGHLPASPDLVRAVWTASAGLVMDWDLELVGTRSEDDLVDVVAMRLREWRANESA